MIRLLFILSFVTIFSLGSAQDFPVFKNSKDSVLFSQAGNRLWNRLPGDTTNLARLNFDSISRVIERLRQKAIGWSQVYKPRSSFVPYADLKSGKVNPDNITRLSISNIQSRQLPKEVLLCKNLEELELVNTRINEIQAEVNTLTKLTSIYLYNNVPSGRLILGKNDHVSYLRIAGHHPDKLPRSYKNFSLLDSLNINRTMATRLPNVKKNKELKIIYAMRNNITLRSSKKNTSLEYLDLRMNKISVIPNSIGRKYPALKTLSFNTNPIKKVKPGLGKLKNLEYLSFYTTGLTKIPKSVYQLSKLKVIDLFDNNIETIDPEIKNLQKLEVLYLANNKIYGLPDEIGELKSLESL
jgi:Leucine-rich repeat (LRR) protein